MILKTRQRPAFGGPFFTDVNRRLAGILPPGGGTIPRFLIHLKQKGGGSP